MKITHPIATRCASFAISWLARAWVGTQSIWVRYRGDRELAYTNGGPGIHVFWHETMLFPLYCFCGPGTSTLVSQHRDGELITQVMGMFRGRAIRGSSTRGGSVAIRNMIRQGRIGHMSITPDGPRGPRRVVQKGAIYVASMTGAAITPIGFGFGNCWRAKSWDRMMLPRPGENAVCVVGEPISVPPKLDRDQVEEYRLKVQAALDDVQAEAEHLADSRTVLDDMEPGMQSARQWRLRRSKSFRIHA